MNKICISIVAIGFLLISPAHAALYNITGTFTQYASDGSVSYNGNIDGIFSSYDSVSGSINMNLDNLWTFYDTSIVGDIITTPGSYSWEACLSDGSANCTAPDPINANIGTGQWGMHGLYNWYTSTSIDLVNVWDVSIDSNGVISLIAVDSDGDGIRGVAEVDGPFPSYSLALDLTLTPVPVPAAIWLFSSGLIGLLGMTRLTKA